MMLSQHIIAIYWFSPIVVNGEHTVDCQIFPRKITADPTWATARVPARGINVEEQDPELANPELVQVLTIVLDLCFSFVWNSFGIDCGVWVASAEGTQLKNSLTSGVAVDEMSGSNGLRHVGRSQR